MKVENSAPIQNNPLKIIEINDNGQSFNIIDFFLSDVMECKSDYYDFLRAVNSASVYDEIHIHINCYGGDLDSGIQIYHSLMRSRAKKIIFVEGASISAASVVMMAADEIEFCPWSSIMIHSYSGGEYGKFQELQSSANFSRSWFTRLMYEIYEDFLTKNEIEQVLNGKDLWLNADECSQRFKKLFKKRDKEYRKMRKENERIDKEISKLYKKFETEEKENEDDE